MTEQTNPNAELRKSLERKGITSGLKLAKYLKSPGVIFFLRGQDGWENARAELRLLNAGDTLTFRPEPGEGEVRRACVEKAMDEGWAVLGIDSWSHAPFSNCWLPTDDIARLHEEFGSEELPQSA